MARQREIAAAAALGAGALLLLAARGASASVRSGGNSFAPLDWSGIALDLPAVLDSIMTDEIFGDPYDSQYEANSNVRAFLYTIRVAEGTADADGYRALFGHTRTNPRLFDSFADHPRIATRFTNQRGERLWTTAAGAYQFVAVSPIPGGGTTKANTWDRIAAKLQLPDFSPMSQDAAAIELIRERGALDDVYAGRFDAAIDKVKAEWASLPGAGYAQPERSLESLRLAYISAGGVFA
jgi:lysozyme